MLHGQKCLAFLGAGFLPKQAIHNFYVPIIGCIQSCKRRVFLRYQPRTLVEDGPVEGDKSLLRRLPGELGGTAEFGKNRTLS